MHAFYDVFIGVTKIFKIIKYKLTINLQKKSMSCKSYSLTHYIKVIQGYCLK